MFIPPKKQESTNDYQLSYRPGPHLKVFERTACGTCIASVVAPPKMGSDIWIIGHYNVVVSTPQKNISQLG
jgi:hypothetical protein